MTYYVKLDPLTQEPRRLLRAEPGFVEVWWNNQWQSTTLMMAELDGLGGSSDYRQLPADAVIEQWQARLGF